MKRLNAICLNCKCLNNDCTGTTQQAFNGCLLKETIPNTKEPITNRNKYIYLADKDKQSYRLFTYDLYRETNDTETGEKYKPVIITQWTDNTEKAQEKAHKRYYFLGDFFDIYDYLKSLSDDNLKELFKNPENTRFTVLHSEFYTVNGKTYKKGGLV